MLYANSRSGDTRSVLLILQGMDTAGKGGIVKHVVGAANPQGIRYHAFGVPTEEERKHHYLWRIRGALLRSPEVGFAFIETALFVKKFRQVEQTAYLMRRQIYRPAQLRLGIAELIFLFRDSGAREVNLGRVILSDGGQQRFCPIDTAPNKPGRFHIEFKQVVQRFAIVRIKLNRPFESLPRFTGEPERL